jgi:superfamily II DNA/RNA helicase
MLHGDMAQSARTEVLERFKRGEMKLLVCSDVAARGLDIQDMSHVFNFDVPASAEDYVHRIGRTARAGREGRAFTIATPEDSKYVTAIERLIDTPLPRMTLDGIESAELQSPSRNRRKANGRQRGAETDTRPPREDTSPSREDTSPPREIEPRQKPPSQSIGPTPRPSRPPRREEPDKPVVGMGDHVPAFMLREPKLGKKER